MRKTALALAAVGLLSAFTAAVPSRAEAHDWNRGRHGWQHRHHNNKGAAIGLGILGGIIAGAAIASSSNHYYYAPYGTPYGYMGSGYYR